MKTFTNLKRDLRTFYKPRGRDRRRGDEQAFDGDDTESRRSNSSIRLDSVPSTPVEQNVMDVAKSAESQRTQVGGHQGSDAAEPSGHRAILAETSETGNKDTVSDSEQITSVSRTGEATDRSINATDEPKQQFLPLTGELQDQGEVIKYAEPFGFEERQDLEAIAKDTKPSASKEPQDQGDVTKYTKPFVFDKPQDQEAMTEETERSGFEETQDQKASKDNEPIPFEEPQDQESMMEDEERFSSGEPQDQEAMTEDTNPLTTEESRDQEEAMEDSQPLTFEEAQAVRDQTYLSFDCEEEDDFTDGPARFVLGVDGIKHCAALLMTHELSQKTQKAIHGQREYLRVETAGLFQRESISRLERGVSRQISSCHTRLAIREEENRLDSEDAQKLEQQLEKLELMLQDVKLRRQGVNTDVEVEARRLRSLQAAANKHLEEAFICANLLAPEEEEPEPEIEDLDVAQEYEIFCRKLETANDEPFEAAAPPLDMNTEHLEVPPPSEKEQAHQKIINTLWASKETLDQARRDFEEREVLRAREFQANMEAADRGEATTDDSPEAFDVRWVLRYGELTRDLIDAEAAYASVKRTAFEAGVPLPFVDNETVCEVVEDEGVGYTISKEQEFVASVPSPTVRRWLAKVPEGVEVGSPSFGDEGRSEADEWEAEEVGISDSVSLVAEGRERARIDRWRKACVAEKEE